MKRFTTIVILACLLLASFCATAYEGRRPGTIGVYSQRHLTQARNSLGVVIGPKHNALLGSRFGDNPAFDAGYQLIRSELRTPGNIDMPSSQLVHQANAGVMFGLLDNLEAGAIFLPFTLWPDFSYDAIRVPITYSFMTKNVDVGIRLHIKTPGDTGWGFSPGAPLLVRLGHGRIDTGFYLPLYKPDEGLMFGLNVPLRAGYNFTPNLYAGLEGGVYIPDFTAIDELGVRVPLGAFAGFTVLGGQSIYDITASFMWDDFAYLGVDDFETLQYESFRFSIGLSWRRMVM